MKRIMSKLFFSVEALLGGVIGAVLSFIAPIQPFLWLMVGLVMADTITGIIAASRRGENVDNKGIYRLSMKIATYFASIVSCYGVEVVLKIPGHLTYIAVGAIALTELLSILENTKIVTGANIAAIVMRLFPEKMKPDDNKKSDEE